MTSLDQLEKINQYVGDGEGSLWAVEKNDYKKPKLPQVSSALATKASLVQLLRTKKHSIVWPAKLQSCCLASL
jgi:hypothetical protein